MSFTTDKAKVLSNPPLKNNPVFCLLSAIFCILAINLVLKSALLKGLLFMAKLFHKFLNNIVPLLKSKITYSPGATFITSL